MLSKFYLALAFGLFCNVAHCELVTLDLTDAASTAGDSFENTGTFSTNGVTFSVSAATTLGDGTGSFSANGSNAGVDSDGVTGAGGDSASEIDNGETLTFSLTFAATTTVSLNNIDFQGVGGSASDQASVSINGGAATNLFTGQADFNGSSDVWTPSGGISLSSTNTIAITTSDQISLQAISFDINLAPVPEPASAITFAGICSTLALWRRRRD